MSSLAASLCVQCREQLVRFQQAERQQVSAFVLFCPPFGLSISALGFIVSAVSTLILSLFEWLCRVCIISLGASLMRLHRCGTICRRYLGSQAGRCSARAGTGRSPGMEARRLCPCSRTGINRPSLPHHPSRTDTSSRSRMGANSPFTHTPQRRPMRGLWHLG